MQALADGLIIFDPHIPWGLVEIIYVMLARKPRVCGLGSLHGSPVVGDQLRTDGTECGARGGVGKGTETRAFLTRVRAMFRSGAVERAILAG